MIRFPEQRLTVAVLCNMRDLDARDQDVGSVPLTKKVLDIYLASQFKSALSRSTPSVMAASPESGANKETSPLPQLTEDSLKQFAGLYWDGRTESVRKFEVKNDKLVATRLPDGGSLDFEYKGGTQFVRGPTILTFDKELTEVIVSQPGAQLMKLTHVREFQDKPGALDEYTGQFYSTDIDATWRFAVGQNHLILSLKNFRDEILQPAFADAFFTTRGLIHFLRDQKGQINGLEAMNIRVKSVRFVKGTCAVRSN